MTSSENMLLGELKKSFAIIWKSKMLFLLLAVLQIIFFVVFSFINIKYQTKILENAKAITDYISQQNIDEASIAEKIMQQKSILGDDPLSISRNFNEMLKDFREYLVFLFLFLLLFMAIMWALSHKLVHKANFKKTLENLFKIFAVLLFYLGLIFVFFYSLFNISITNIATESSKFFIKYFIFLIVSIVLVYFMFISLALADKTGLNEIVRNTLRIGISKIHHIFFAYLINVILLAIPAYLLHYFIERNLFILFLSMLMMVFSFVFGRIFLINVVERLEV